MNFFFGKLRKIKQPLRRRPPLPDEHIEEVESETYSKINYLEARINFIEKELENASSTEERKLLIKYITAARENLSLFLQQHIHRGQNIINYYL